MQKPSCNKATQWVENILNGNIRSTSQFLTLVEQRDPGALPVLKALYPHTGKAKLIGITGPAGVGKSTLINRLVTDFRKKNQSVGILAIDPSSPLSGGTILGDRLRMHSHFLDQEVFIRSLSTHGAWGGLSPGLFDAIHVLDAMGKEIILIETVGVGQDEVRIAQLAHIVLLVLTSGMGDAIQTMKAGLIEIGDLIAVNKGDLLDCGPLIHELQEVNPKRPAIKVSAENGTGLKALVSELEKGLKKTEAVRTKKERFVREELQSLLYEKLQLEGTWFPFTNDLIESVVRRRIDPYEPVESWAEGRSSP